MSSIRKRMTFENKTDRLLPFTRFLERLALCMVFSTIILGISLGGGAVGYHELCGLSWVDSILNASMILTGMGPVDKPESVAGKLFASGYALYSGLVFITVSAITLSPVMHRILHMFHLADEDYEDQAEEAAERRRR